ncbi:MAG: hypothetical protein ACOYN0_06345 [Phycisphaerales bacterium]
MTTLLGLCELALLVARSGFRLRGKYWTWRMQTAFGRGVPADRRELLLAVLEYARWVRRMKV